MAWPNQEDVHTGLSWLISDSRFFYYYYFYFECCLLLMVFVQSPAGPLLFFQALLNRVSRFKIFYYFLTEVLWVDWTDTSFGAYLPPSWCKDGAESPAFTPGWPGRTWGMTVTHSSLVTVGDGLAPKTTWKAVRTWLRCWVGQFSALRDAWPLAASRVPAHPYAPSCPLQSGSNLAKRISYLFSDLLYLQI